MPLRLSHYVYSSLGGYRTLYSSSDMPRNQVSDLEALARNIYRPAQSHDIFAWLRPDDGHVCVMKAFQNGTDHAGRRRSCVHAVVFAASDAAGSWFFSPLSVPDSVFLSPESSLQSLPNQLVPECELPPPASFDPPKGLSRERLTALLSVMASPGTTAVVLDRTGSALRTVRALSWVLPPSVRETLTVSAPLVLPAVEGIPRPRIAILPCRDPHDALPARKRAGQLTAPELPAPGWPDDAARPDVVLNFPDGAEDPGVPYDVYAEFVASNLADERGRARVRKLVELIERQPPRPELTQGRYWHLLEGFGKVEPCLERGVVDVRRAPKRSLSAVGDFARAGMAGAALDILESIVSFAVEGYDVEAAPLRAMVAKLRSGGTGAAPATPEAFEYVAERLAELVGLIGMDRRGLPEPPARGS